jgi:hypothetical protein
MHPYKTKRSTQSRNLTKLTWITFVAPRFEPTWDGSNLQLLLKRSNLYEVHCAPVLTRLLCALTLARAKAFLNGALLTFIGYTHAQPTEPGKHNAIFSWPAGRRISQTSCHSLPGSLECPWLVPPGPDTCCTRPAASDCNTTNAPTLTKLSENTK